MKISRVFILIFLIVAVILAGITFNLFFMKSTLPSSKLTTTHSARYISSAVTADGVVTAQSQANLHFQISGKLIRLPFKKGDTVKSGQVIAALDSYTIQKQLQASLNTYRSVRDSFDQVNENAQSGVQKAQLTNPYDYYAKSGIGTDTKESAINDAIKRMVDQNQANLDNSVINVQLANYAYQLSTILSPLDGILLNEDVTVPGVNITPATNFIVADPSTAVFRANIPASNINYIMLGASAEIAVDGFQDKIHGTVINIYPSKVTLPNGQSVYQVDIQSDQLTKLSILDQTGTAMIKTNAENLALVPAWTVLAGEYIWVDNYGKPELKKVEIGKTYGQEIEIKSGLSSQDKIIIEPELIKSLNY